MASTSNSGESPRIEKVNESVYELNQRVGKPSIQVVFFHGLLLEGDYSDAHWLTWQSEDGTCCWPQTWLVEELPGAHVFSVSSSGCLGKTSTERFDMFLQAENLISDLVEANIGQDSRCPVVLVGHSIGGLVIKEVCCQAYRKVFTSQGIQKTRLTNFLNNLRGVFYYATPHRGSLVAEHLADIIGSPLLKYFKALSKEAARLDYEFERMCKLYDKCQSASLGENLPTKLGLLGDVTVVLEASERGANYNADENADHFSICRPKDKVSRRFRKLKGFLADIASEMEEQRRPDNFQRLPKTITGITIQLQDVKSKLKGVKSLGLVGMGGLGKTTLAMALFNDFCLGFDYTCFVSRVKDKIDTVDVEEQIWENMYFEGKRFSNDKCEWSKVRDKRLLVVLDDIAGDCDITRVLDDTLSGSLFIVTSRERDLLDRSVDVVHDVEFLGADNAKRLFMSHAFPRHEIAPAMYRDLVELIVKKCEGLPLTLEVFGQFLKKKENVNDWRQTLNALHKAEAIKGFDERLWAKLRVSYDGLTDEEQKMFLDATMFFIGRGQWTLRNAKTAWKKAYDTDCVSVLWQTLVDMCLVYQVGDEERIKVHEQVQSLGRRIAEDPSTEYQCRLWDIRSMLEQLQYEPELLDEDFIQMVGVVEALGVYPSGIQGSWPSQHKLHQQVVGSSAIRCFQCEAMAFLATVFQPERLGPHRCFSFLRAELVYLKLWNCSRMQSFPSYIGQCLALSELHLAGWGNGAPNITHVPNAIGQLSRLEILTFKSFDYLEELPDTLGRLPQLTHLALDYCFNLHFLPDSLGQLSMLEVLELRNLEKIVRLPDSLTRLMNLSRLVLYGLALRAIPDLMRIGSLHSLSVGALPYLVELPPWLEGIDVTTSSMSIRDFKKCHGRSISSN